MSATRNYDPISATVFRLGFPDGDEFFLENIDFMREMYGDEITDTLRAAYTEGDVSKAEEFAALLVDGFSYEVVGDDTEKLEIEYSANGEVEGSLKLFRSGVREGDLLVQAILKASEGIWTNARVKETVDAEIAAQSAGSTRP